MSAHDFVWRHARHPYDLVVYQFGNSSHHDYMWPYALRYPGLVVLHDTRLHHARAASLLRERRAADYRAELAWSHPDVSPDVAELAVAGFDSALYYDWPMVRPLVATSRLVAVPRRRRRAPSSLEAIPARARAIDSPGRRRAAVAPSSEADASRRVRSAMDAAETVLFGVFGGLTPEKRLTQILDALVAIAPYAPACATDARRPRGALFRRGRGNPAPASRRIASSSPVTWRPTTSSRIILRPATSA